MRLIPALFCALWFALPATRAAEVIPPAPKNHFNDYAGIVRADTVRQLDAQLTQFERDTSNQLVVAIFPHMQSDSSIEDYTFRVKEAWGVGLKGRNNGAVLFIFSQDRTLFIQVGYGLEPRLTDALSKRIIEEEITPRFRQGDFEGGVRAGTQAMMAAVRGEYTGTGRIVAEAQRGTGRRGPGGFVFLIVAMIVLSLLSRLFRRNTVYTRRGRISPWISTGGWGGGGGWGGSGGGGGGGTFSGGGGSGGGGGAGGRW
jgi:uncharacterized protein